jgi:hypothetical protein
MQKRQEVLKDSLQSLRKTFLKQVHSIVAVLARRFRSRAVVELENLALRQQLQFFVATGRVGPD